MTALIYDLIYTVPVCLVAVILGHTYMGVDEMTAGVYVFTVAASVMCVAFGHLKAKGRLLFAGIVITVLIAVAFVGKADIFRENLWGLWIVIVCIVCFSLQVIAVHNMIVRTALAAVCLVMLVLFMFLGRSVGREVFVLLLFFVAASVVEVIQAGWKKESNVGPKDHVVFILPFLVILVVPLIFASIPSEPYDWKFVKNIYEGLRNGYEIIVQTLMPEDGWDGGDNMGFSERAALGGSVEDDPYKVLFVSSDSMNDYRIYLSGKSFDTFDGRRWVKKDDSDMDYRAFDVIETIAAVHKYNGGHENDYMHLVRLHVKYEGVRTSCVFVPAKSYPDTSAAMVQKGGDMRLAKGKKGDYIVDYYRINRDGSDFDTMLANESRLDAKDWQLALQNAKGIDASKYPFAEYEKYRDSIYRNYAEDPKLSQKAMQFMDELLGGCKNDLEKAERIEKFLAGFDYTTTPGDLPDTVKSGADFIDYFIFDKREGFCTHFASAFVLMARSQGIPARYVQGYSVLSKSTGFEVLSDRTHAWPELYFEGVGWTGFEPTPGYRQSAGWEVTSVENNGAVSRNPYEDYEKKYGGNDQEETDSGTEEDEGLLGNINSVMVRRVVLFIIGFVVLFAVADGIFRRYSYRRMSDREKVIALCKKNMRMLRRIGIKPGTGETLREFGDRIKDGVPKEFAGFIDIYEQVLYAKERPYSDDLDKLEKNFTEKLHSGIKFIRFGSDILFEKHR